MGRVRREWIALAALVVAACGDEAAVAPTAPQTSVTSDGSGEEVHLDFNARMALAARRAPGFAGIYVEDGTWRIAMKGSRALDAATRAEVRDLLISGSTGDDARAVAENRANTGVRAQASYDFAELYARPSARRSTLGRYR